MVTTVVGLVLGLGLRCRHSGLPTTDAITAATAISKRSFRVVTDDPYFKTIKEIKTEWA